MFWEQMYFEKDSVGSAKNYSEFSIYVILITLNCPKPTANNPHLLLLAGFRPHLCFCNCRSYWLHMPIMFTFELSFNNKFVELRCQYSEKQSSASLCLPNVFGRAQSLFRVVIYQNQVKS